MPTYANLRSVGGTSDLPVFGEGKRPGNMSRRNVLHSRQQRPRLRIVSRGKNRVSRHIGYCKFSNIVIFVLFLYRDAGLPNVRIVGWTKVLGMMRPAFEFIILKISIYVQIALHRRLRTLAKTLTLTRLKSLTAQTWLLSLSGLVSVT